MATQQSFVDYVAEQSRLEQRLSFKKLFGEYAVYLDGKVVAFACDNSLFIKPAAETARLTAELPQRPPYPGAKDYPVADQLLDEPDELRMLLLATAAVMPLPKPKVAGKGKAASKAGAVPKVEAASKAKAVSKARPASKAKAVSKDKAAPAKAVPKTKVPPAARTAPKARSVPKSKAVPKAGAVAKRRAAK